MSLLYLSTLKKYFLTIDVKLTRYDFLLFSFILALPLYITISIKTDWVWVSFSALYILSLIFFSKRNSLYFRTVVLVFSLLPFLSLHVLLFVNYYFQGSRFNEAFYYHFNRLGVVGHEGEALVLLGVTCCYYCFLCFFIFKLQSRKIDNRFSIYGGMFIVLLALGSPQSLSFAGMYLNVHSHHPFAQYLLSLDAIGDPAVNRLLEDAKKDFEYNPEEKKNLIFIYAESLEANFFDKELFPGRFNFLDDIQGSSIEFTNIVQTPYTGWTISGMLSSLCGIPLQIPLDSSSHNFSLYDDFMPNAECISDLLSKEEYNLTYLGGADLDFAGKRSFES